MEVTEDQFNAMRAALERLPDPEVVHGRMTRAAALRALLPSIEEQKERGHSLRTIVAALSATGVRCTARALKEAAVPPKARRRRKRGVGSGERAAGPGNTARPSGGADPAVSRRVTGRDPAGNGARED